MTEPTRDALLWYLAGATTAPWLVLVARTAWRILTEAWRKSRSPHPED